MANNEAEFSLSDTFNAFAKRAVADFPELERRFGIYDIPTHTLYGSFDPEEKEILLALGQEWALRVNARAYALDPSTQGEGYYLMSFRENASDALSHELGHLIAPNGTSLAHGQNFRECVAEAFAHLYPKLRCSKNTLSGSSPVTDILHFSLPVLQELRGLMEKYDLEKVVTTPVAAANLAYRLSLLYALPEKDLKKLGEIFEPVTKAMEDVVQTDFYPGIEACIKTVLEDHGKYSPLVMAAGKAWMSTFLYDEDATAWRNMYKTTAFWDDARAKIAEKEQSLQKPETLEQRLAHEAKDMMVMGLFDKDFHTKIDPSLYESKENMTYLQRAGDIYTAIRYFQETNNLLPSTAVSPVSAAAVEGLRTMSIAVLLDQDKTQTIALARQLAEKTQAANDLSSNPRRKIQAAI